MSITLTTVDHLAMRATNLVAAFVSWSTSVGVTLTDQTSNLVLRAYGSNVKSFATECAALIAATGYSSLDSSLRADVAAIQLVMVDVAASIADLIAPDTHFTVLGSTRQSAIVSEVVAGGIAADWAGVPSDLKPDLLQHEIIDATSVAAIVAAVTIA
jgi:hypothetical protein